jgi:hypothetical protein
VDKEQSLAHSDLMQPVQGTVDIDVPIEVLWQCFGHAGWWPRWNKCFLYVRNRDLVRGRSRPCPDSMPGTPTERLCIVFSRFRAHADPESNTS